MTISPFAAELIAERQRDLLHQTEYHRQRRAHPTWRRPRASTLTLRVRPIRVGDASLLADIFARLSLTSRLARFMAPKQGLTVAELRYFTDVDHHNHEALIAVTRLRGKPVGVARFIRHAQDPTTAEVAVEVVDEWQNRGVGSLLAQRLAARAQHENISHFTALMSADNRRSRRLLARVGKVTLVGRDGPTVSYRVALSGPAPRPSRRPHVLLPPQTVRLALMRQR